MSELLTADKVYVGLVDLYSNGAPCCPIACLLSDWLRYIGSGYRGLCLGVFRDSDTASKVAYQCYKTMEQARIDNINARYWSQRAAHQVQA